ncbi:MAG: GTPase HflX [Thermotoga caldifontis]|uniref:GTPase HflX n=1 Tax=Thermotoga caldifontis TaxID=1508419 RepID=UPI003C7B43F1
MGRTIEATALKKVLVLTIESEETSCEELAGLLANLDAEVVEVVRQRREFPDSRFYLGRGKVESLVGKIAELGIDYVVVDGEISPLQAKNLENTLKVPVKDRTQVILDVFARHATTKEGKLQVELAQLQYELPRLVGEGRSLSRLGGGVGTRGPGEPKLEERRRQIRERINALRKELNELKKDRDQQRKLRSDSELATVSIVGYTNAGKSCLLAALSSDSSITVSSKLFSTLAPVVRRVKLPDGRVALFKDTVGFIRKVPHTIVEAFKSTLEEICYSDVIILLVDATDPEYAEKIRVAEEVLSELHADAIPRLLVFNKIDLLTEEKIELLSDVYPSAMFVSALKRIGIDALLNEVCRMLEKSEVEEEFFVGLDHLHTLEKFREKVAIKKSVFTDEGLIVRVKARESVLKKLAILLNGGMKTCES